MMHGRGKSDSAIVAVKPANKAERSAAEPVEQRAGTKGNAGQQSTCRAQEPGKRVTSAGAHTASCEGKEEGEVHHRSSTTSASNCSTMAFFELKKNAAPGMDGLTWRDYERRPRSQSRGSARTASIEERIGHCRPGGSTYPSRMADSAQSRLRPSKTRSSRGRRPRCSTRSTRRTSSGSRTDSGPGAARTMRWTRSWSGSEQEGELDTGRRHPIVLR